MQNSNSSGKTVGIVVGVIAALLVIGGVVFWTMNMNDDEAAQEAVSSSQQSTESANTDDTTNTRTIVAVAVDTPDLSTLVTAVQAADLVETLQGAGPFTVFAPTNAAFEALPTGTLASLLLPENKDQLASILTYHVVAGQVLASDLSVGQVITTVQGGTLTVKIVDGKVYLVDATGKEVVVEQADVNADNGVVHVIGGVLLPS